MSKIEEVIARIYSLDTEDPKEVMAKFVKMIEEIGELAELMLMIDGYKYNMKGKTIEECVKETKFEGADIFMLLIIVLKMYGHSFEDLVEATDKKLDRWQMMIDHKKNGTQPEVPIAWQEAQLKAAASQEFTVQSTDYVPPQHAINFSPETSYEEKIQILKERGIL